MAPTDRIRLLPPQMPAALPELTARQKWAMEHFLGGDNVSVLGSPGTGKTTLAMAAAKELAARGIDSSAVAVLSATRVLAGRMRDDLVALSNVNAKEPLSRTPASLAFSILRSWAVSVGGAPYQLISGPEQDAMLALILDRYVEADAVPREWPSWITPQVLAQDAFRHELRDLFMRASEHGLGPAEMAALSRTAGVPEWACAAQIFAAYRREAGADQAMGAARLDPAEIVSRAEEILALWDESERPRWSHVIVDDYQDATEATRRLLARLAGDGSCLLLLGWPETSVQGYRGAKPNLILDAGEPAPVGFGAVCVTLDRTFRQAGALWEANRRIQEMGGTLGAGPVRPAPADSSVAEGDVDVRVFPSQEALGAYAAYRIRDSHLEGLSWDQIAVIGRSHADIVQIKDVLSSSGVPVRVEGQDIVIGAEPASLMLLEALSAAQAPQNIDAARVASLLSSPMIGMDSLGLRDLRKALRIAEFSTGGTRGGDDLLLACFNETASADILPERLRTPVRRLQGIVAAGRAVLGTARNDLLAALWAIWGRTGLERTWREQALAGGPAGQLADRHLDAISMLFAVAERYVDRMGNRNVAEFVDYIASQDLPADTLAPRGYAGAAVTCATAASAVGRAWDVVIVVGLQEGSWPDLRLRDSVLEAGRLVDIVEGNETEQDAAARRREVYHEEKRFLLMAASRASSKLVVCAVKDADLSPSPFLDLLDEAPEDGRPLTPGPVPLDLRGMVTRLRARLLADPEPADAALLAALARENVPGADPEEWFGILEDSSSDALVESGEQVVVSPSKLEILSQCPLRWALEGVGGSRSSTGATNLGQIIHAIAQDHPFGSQAELLAALDQKWPLLEIDESGLAGRRIRERAEKMIAKLASYLEANASTDPRQEVGFGIDADGVRLAGRVDRLERTSGGVRVVDFKTSKNAITGAEAVSNPQLGAYQFAVDHGGMAQESRSDGARLVYLGTSTVKYSQKEQPSLRESGEGWMAELLEAAASAAHAASFEARLNPGCDYCPVRSCCPLQPEGSVVGA